MITAYDGDPAIFIGLNGAYMKFKGGQPVMDPGLENAVLISLFTKPGWVGNVLFEDENEKIGSDFVDENMKAVTASSLVNREDAAKKALDWLKKEGLASNIEAEVLNRTSNIIDTDVFIQPLGADSLEFRVSKNGLNWIAQKTNPAHDRR